jgi:hypothetical protein
VSYLPIHQDDIVSKLPHFQFTTINDSPIVDTFPDVSTGSRSLQLQDDLNGDDVVSYLPVHQDDIIPKLSHYQFTTINNSRAVDIFAENLIESRSVQPPGDISGAGVVSCLTYSSNQHLSKHHHSQFTTTNNSAVASSSRLSNVAPDSSNGSIFADPFFASDEYNNWFMDTLTKGVRFVLNLFI